MQYLKLVHSQSKQLIYKEIEKIIDKYGVCLIIDAVDEYVANHIDKFDPNNKIYTAVQQLISDQLNSIRGTMGAYLPAKFVQKYKQVLVQFDQD
jgi:hypothetical protein